MAPKNRGRVPAKEQEPDALYRVYRKADDEPVYLPAGKGLPLEDAERQANSLVVDTYIEKVWERPEEAA